MGNLRDHPENGCVLATLVQAIRERGNVDEEKLLQMHATTDVSALWEDLGPIIDKLEHGEYAGDDNSEGEQEIKSFSEALVLDLSEMKNLGMNVPQRAIEKAKDVSVVAEYTNMKVSDAASLFAQLAY